MIWDIAGLVFVCVTANHLGLVKAVEEVIGRGLPVIGCVKCLTFWAVLAYTLFALHQPLASLAISFASSYTAIWLELLEGCLDTLYIRLYDKIYSDKEDDEAPAGGVGSHSESTLP